MVCTVFTSAGDVETVTVVRPARRTKFGDESGPPTEFAVDGCLFAPGPSAELHDAANQVSTDGTVYAPAGTDVVATDRMRVRGALYQVVGDPQVWNTAGVVVVLRRVTG